MLNGHEFAWLSSLRPVGNAKTSAAFLMKTGGNDGYLTYFYTQNQYLQRPALPLI